MAHNESPQTPENRHGNVSEFYDDVYIYGKLYADIDATAINWGGGGDINFNNVVIDNDLWVGGISTFVGPVNFDYLTVKQRLDVGIAGTVFTAISTTNGIGGQGQTGGRVGIGSTQPTGRFEVGIGGATLDPLQPIDPFKSSLIVTDEGDVGVGNSQPDGIFEVGNNCLVVTDDCKVGLGTTTPAGRFEIGEGGNSSFVVTTAGKVGIGTTGFETYSDGTKFKINSGDDVFVVTEGGSVGIGSTDPTGITVPGYNPSADGQIRLNVDGSVKIDRHIIDSADSYGANGNYLKRDGNGVRWVVASPVNQDGFFVQDEHGTLPLGGSAQLFSTLNFTQKNSAGLGTDTLIPIPDPNNPTAIARIQTQDYWGHTNQDNDSPIYRMTKVGIENNNPQSTLDITGTVHATSDVDFDATLNVDGNVTFNALLDVDGKTTFNDTTDSTSPTSSSSVQIDGGVGIVKRLNVGGAVDFDSTLNVDADTSLNAALDVDGLITSNNTTEASGIGNASAVFDGGVGIAKKLFVGGITKVEDGTQSTTKDNGALIVEGGVGIEKNLNVGQKATIFGDLELESQLTDFFNSEGVGACKTDYRLSSFNVGGVGAGVSWRPSGVQTKKTIWVTKNGCDTNSGLLEGDAKHTIAAAAAIAKEGDTIKVRSGVYNENNPIGLRTDVAITGEDLRLVTVVPNNANRDVFHVRRGCMIENLSFAGSSVAVNHPGCAAAAFPPTLADVNAGKNFQAVSGYAILGPANEGASGRYKSPYIRNCTNFMTGSIGMRIDGNHCDAAFSGDNNLGQDIKSFVCDSFTQYNENGIGVSLTNNGYAQLVSIFTIGCDIGIFCSSGGQCDLTNSNSSFGNKGLVADGYGDVEFDGTVLTTTDAETDTVVINNTQDQGNNNRTPFDGQGAYFHLNLSQYNDTPANNTITEPLQQIRSLEITNGGNNGDYNAGAPPIITVIDSGNNNLPDPLGPEGILPEFSANVSAAGTITSIDVINSGRNFLPTQNLVVSISGGGAATATVDTDPILYTVSDATDGANHPTGISTVTFNEFIPYNLNASTRIDFVRLSRIITSSHSFEYIGSGTDLNTANPFQGGKPRPENEVIAKNGGQVPFTSTDQKGNFRIGDGLTIDQTTSTIRGRDFNRAIQAQLTPLILALR